jgi:hypothetical protein
MLSRCCSDTLKHYSPRDPTIGLELSCRWCDGYLKFERIAPNLFGWMPHEGNPTREFVEREGSEDATAGRERRYTEILGRERSKA